MIVRSRPGPLGLVRLIEIAAGEAIGETDLLHPLEPQDFVLR